MFKSEAASYKDENGNLVTDSQNSSKILGTLYENLNSAIRHHDVPNPNNVYITPAINIFVYLFAYDGDIDIIGIGCEMSMLPFVLLNGSL